MGINMKDDTDTIITRSQRKKLEIEKAELSFDFLRCTISRSILKYLYDDISKYGENIKLDRYLKKIGKELKTKEFELQIEYDNVNPKNLSENEQLYIGSVEITNEFFKDIIKDIMKDSRKRGFSILKYLKSRIKEEDKKYKVVSEKLQKVHDKLKIGRKNKKPVKMLMSSDTYEDEEASDVDEKGNIKGLIAYSDDEEEYEDNKSLKIQEKQIR